MLRKLKPFFVLNVEEPVLERGGVRFIGARNAKVSVEARLDLYYVVQR